MSALRRWAYVLIPTAVLGGLVYQRVQAKKADEATEKKEQAGRRGGAAAVEIAIAQARPLINSVQAVGSVVSPYSVGLSPRVAGRITFLEVREGDPVKAGQVLARIDPSEANAKVYENQASVSEARSRLAQAQATVQSNQIQIEQNIRQARAELASAQAAYTQTKTANEGALSDARATVAAARADLTASNALLKNADAQLVAARAQLTNQQTNLKRLQSLLELGYVAAQEVDDAKTAVASARADVEVRLGSVESARAAVSRSQAELNAENTRVNTITASGRAELKVAQARIDQARASLTQAEANRAQTPAYQENINALRSGVDAAEAQLKVARVGQNDTELRSPIAGSVTARSGDPGSLASPSTPVLKVEFLNWLFINATLPLSESGKIVKGLPVEITLDGLKDQIFSGQVDQVVPSADATDRQFLVKIRIENPDRVIRPGMFARVNIEVDRIEAKVVVPNDAVTNGKVMVVDAEGKATQREVKVGRTNRNDVEILSGLNVGEKVVVLSFSQVRDGGKVNITAERLSDGTRRPIEAPKKAPGGRPGVGR
ncbi:MAG: efflux RND transporter periplasmic adaptor subunit [Chthonomonas sp.]|nr:efflux RND transporter periplasmic adaptor subunit [Chthonomonas sp.]